MAGTVIKQSAPAAGQAPWTASGTNPPTGTTGNLFPATGNYPGSPTYFRSVDTTNSGPVVTSPNPDNNAGTVTFSFPVHATSWSGVTFVASFSGCKIAIDGSQIRLIGSGGFGPPLGTYPHSIPDNTAVLVVCSIVGGTASLGVVRISDGTYLQTDGTFSSTYAICLTWTDPSPAFASSRVSYTVYSGGPTVSFGDSITGPAQTPAVSPSSPTLAPGATQIFSPIGFDGNLVSFSAAHGTLAPANGIATTYTAPGAPVSDSLVATGLFTPSQTVTDSIMVAASAATGFTASVPSLSVISQVVNVKVTPVGGNETGTITVLANGGGLTNVSVILNFSNSATPQNAGFTPTTAGSITFSFTNNTGLTNPASIFSTADAGRFFVPYAPYGATFTGSTLTGYTIYAADGTVYSPPTTEVASEIGATGYYMWTPRVLPLAFVGVVIYPKPAGWSYDPITREIEPGPTRGSTVVIYAAYGATATGLTNLGADLYPATGSLTRYAPLVELGTTGNYIYVVTGVSPSFSGAYVVDPAPGFTNGITREVEPQVVALPGSGATISDITTLLGSSLVTLAANQAVNVTQWLSRPIPPPIHDGVPSVDLSYNGGITARLGDGTTSTVSATSITLDPADPAHATNLVGIQIEILTTTGGNGQAGQVGTITASNTSTGVQTIAGGWSGGQAPSGTVIYQRNQIPAGGLPLAQGVVQAGATSTTVSIQGTNLLGNSHDYRGRRLYGLFGSKPTIYTDPCLDHTVTGSGPSAIHTFTFTVAQRETFGTGDTVAVLGA